MRRLIVLTYFLLNALMHLNAQVPTTLSYQGLLTDLNGAPVADASYDIAFSFYTELSGGTVAFTRGPFSVQTFKGLFTVILGNGQGNNNAALPYTLGSTQYYVGIKNGTQVELTPRAVLTAVPYAFQAQSVVSVDAATITTGTLPDLRLSTHLQDLADGSLTGSKVGTGINAANVTVGTLPASVIPSSGGVPVGTIIAYGGTTIPAGWEFCDGRSLSTTGTYAALFDAIGSNWGSTSAGTFRLPDLRGRFTRGRDATGGNDPDVGTRTSLFANGSIGDNVGSYQADELKSHQHSFNMNTQAVNQSGASAVSNANVNTGQTSFTGGSETRPINAYVNYIIKY